MLILLPDRLPSLVVLVLFWVVPAVVGLLAAEFLQSTRRHITYALLILFVIGYAAGWFYFNLGRMPPYIPGSTADPTFASPQAVSNLAVFTTVLILPGSALACFLAFYVSKKLSSIRLVRKPRT